MSRLRWLALGVCLAAMLPAHATGVIRVAFPEHVPPWVGADQRPGIAVELLRSALQAEGLSLQPVFYPYARRLAAYRRYEVDALYDVSPATQRREGLGGSLGKALHSFDNLAIGLEKRQLPIERLADLIGLHILAWEGAHTDLPESLDLVEAMAAGKYAEVGDQRHQVRALYLGRVDVILSDRLVFEWQRRRLRGDGQLNLRQPVNYFAILPPREASVLWRDPALRQRIDYRLREMKSDGRYNAVFRRYDADPQP